MGKDDEMQLDEVEEDARDHLETTLQLIKELKQARLTIETLKEDYDKLEQDLEVKDSHVSDLEAEIAQFKQVHAGLVSTPPPS